MRGLRPMGKVLEYRTCSEIFSVVILTPRLNISILTMPDKKSL